MNATELGLAYGRLPTNEKAGWLSRLAFQLTVAARGAYPRDANEPALVTPLMGVNELLHKVLGQSVHLASGTASYPDDVFVRTLCEIADQYQCTHELYTASELASR